MMNRWKIYKLSDIADVQTGPFGSQLHQRDYVDVGTPCIMPCNIGANLDVQIDNIAHLKASDIIRLNKYCVKEGDIIYSRRGDIEKCAYINHLQEGWLCGTGCLRIRPNTSICFPKYLAYLLSTKESKKWIVANAVGTTMLNLNSSILNTMPISLPPLAEQKRIADILSAIDDKIELNRRINANLEQQAQALYKSWFVDNKKDDWEEVPLSEVADFVGGYSYKGNELVESSMTAMATIKNFERKGGFKVDGFKDIVASNKLKAEHHANLFDILVAHTDLTQNADVIGNAEMLLTFDKYSDIIFSMDLVKVLPKQTFPYKYLLAALLKNPHFKKHCMGYVNGTTVLHMSKKALPEYIVNLPSIEEIQSMDNAFKAYYLKMAEILQENNSLSTLRDTLLPKLMSGEITV